MNAQCGIWNFDSRPVSAIFPTTVRKALAVYDWDQARRCEGPGMLICFAPVLGSSAPDGITMPQRTAAGGILTWDGRLDNRADITRELGLAENSQLGDESIVSAAFDRWGKDSLKRIVGDWALVAWNPVDSTLLLARDFLGIRPLYYVFDSTHVVWSSALELLVELAHGKLILNEEFLAGWITFFPAAHLTPYRHIHSVPPGHAVSFRYGERSVVKYWDFDPAKRIRYRTDTDYEHHFLEVFRESVRRRLTSHALVLAELSGGVDSSSIVCIADELIAAGGVGSPLDTVSYYDDSEPSWDERQYFSRIEEKRGRRGHHIAVRWNSADERRTRSGFPPMPGALAAEDNPAREISSLAKQKGYRVLLSGVGGDEFLGGVPNPIPELADLAANVKILGLLRQAFVWAQAQRRPMLQLLLETLSEFLPFRLARPSSENLSWLSSNFVRQHRHALAGYPSRLSFGSALPSFQENRNTLELLRRQISSTPEYQPYLDSTFPFLDRDVLAFLFALPREQLLRPGQRRSLLRRALAGIVPNEVLHRRRKAFVTRGPRTRILTDYQRLTEEKPPMLTVTLGIVNPEELAQTLETIRRGLPANIVSLLRIIGVEQWLRQFPHSYWLRPRDSDFALRSDSNAEDFRLKDSAVTS